MSRLNTTPVSQASGQAAQLFAAIKSAIGMVPNAYAGIGSLSPVALESALQLDGALRKSSLSAKEIEAIKLAVSQRAGCDYCLAAHALMGKKVGLSAQAIDGVRHGQASGDDKLDVLADFVRQLVGTSGTVEASVVERVRAVYSDAQIVDTLLAVTAITFTNLFNRVNDTVLDFPPAP
ncbi:carboxymuconolactone decarboxylase family protein [Herbaspirillum rubrisubalbicans]|uniref:Carboxymuconolactone decarboxylase family protein n=1 Tax=Herbaspirillum rubrisubalbicans TaxID=80842 RepID=A0AAD0XEI3_9BURK|nr:carboxymuconolactone decarboxylase family protein [Herbaspirillum rubrisubalbicans]ALU87415.1 alkylhydroperoxidase [Herbaspirillum rubrisubalbicans M1]AYR22462.1 carboxymuconolactone decarboxylase family protein [Herbaspirillum rubrisubalbicans]